MKKIFFLTALAVMVLASCNRNEEDMGSGSGGSGEKATLTISIQSPEMRATSAVADFGDNTKPADASITNFTVFITNQSDILHKEHFTGVSSAEMQVSTQAKHVYVVANAGNLTGSITTMAQLTSTTSSAYKLDLTSQAANASFATGDASITFTQSGNDFEATVPVVLKFVAARIKVKIVTDGDMATYYNHTATNGSLVLTKVAVLKARGESRLFGTPAVAPAIQTSLIPAAYSTGKKFYEGLENPTSPDDFDYYPATAADFTYNAALLSNEILPGDYVSKAFTKMYHYYMFENDAISAATFPTIVLLKGTYDGKDIYFPVHLAPYEKFTGTNPVNGVIRGNSYNIEITLKGDPRISVGEYPGDTGGTDDPTNPVITAKVTVTVTMSNWEAVPLAKVFGD
jgi:hypothetical protein